VLDLQRQPDEVTGRLRIQGFDVQVPHHRTEFPQHVDHAVEHTSEPTDGV
jgi:hypothetical protein